MDSSQFPIEYRTHRRTWLFKLAVVSLVIFFVSALKVMQREEQNEWSIYFVLLAALTAIVFVWQLWIILQQNFIVRVEFTEKGLTIDRSDGRSDRVECDTVIRCDYVGEKYHGCWVFHLGDNPIRLHSRGFCEKDWLTITAAIDGLFPEEESKPSKDPHQGALICLAAIWFMTAISFALIYFGLTPWILPVLFVPAPVIAITLLRLRGWPANVAKLLLCVVLVSGGYYYLDYDEREAQRMMEGAQLQQEQRRQDQAKVLGDESREEAIEILRRYREKSDESQLNKPETDQEGQP